MRGRLLKFRSGARPSRFPRIAVAAASLLSLIGCAQQSAVRVASKEYFPASVYGPASPRLVSTGPIPRGGGQYLVGRPYVVAGRLYVPHPMTPSFTQVGLASWYGDAFHGRRTANGEIYDKNGITAAHPTMPLPSFARVTNLSNGRSIVVRVNDRGPYHAGRVMDVSARVAQLLDFKRMGMAKVRVDYIGMAPLNGDDDQELLASLRTDGEPAELPGQPRTMLAAAKLLPHLPLGSLFGRSAKPPAPPAQQPHISLIAQSGDSRPAASEAVYDAPAPLPPPRPQDLAALAKERPTPQGRPMRLGENRIPPRRPHPKRMRYLREPTDLLQDSGEDRR